MIKGLRLTAFLLVIVMSNGAVDGIEPEIPDGTETDEMRVTSNTMIIQQQACDGPQQEPFKSGLWKCPKGDLNWVRRASDLNRLGGYPLHEINASLKEEHTLFLGIFEARCSLLQKGLHTFLLVF